MAVLTMRESLIEKRVCAYAESKGWLVYKFSSPAHRGVPDRIFIRKGVMFFIEFKATGKKLTKLQKHTANNIMIERFPVHVVDSIDYGKVIVDIMDK